MDNIKQGATATRVIDVSEFRVSQEPDAFLGRLKAAVASLNAGKLRGEYPMGIYQVAGRYFVSYPGMFGRLYTMEVGA